MTPTEWRVPGAHPPAVGREPPSLQPLVAFPWAAADLNAAAEGLLLEVSKPGEHCVNTCLCTPSMPPTRTHSSSLRRLVCSSSSSGFSTIQGTPFGCAAQHKRAAVIANNIPERTDSLSAGERFGSPSLATPLVSEQSGTAGRFLRG